MARADLLPDFVTRAKPPRRIRHFGRIEPMQTTSPLDIWGMARRSPAQGPR